MALMNTENTYESNIAYSSRELTPVERIKMKDLGSTLSLDEELDTAPDNKIVFKIELVLLIDIKNLRSKSGNTNYAVTVIVDADTGIRYRTSSESFTNALSDIVDDLAKNNIPLTDVSFVAYRKPSKNYSGKNFLTCTLA